VWGKTKRTQSGHCVAAQKISRFRTETPIPETQQNKWLGQHRGAPPADETEP